MKLVVGLGNPGRAYARSRHNVGFQCVEGISSHAGILLSQRRRVALVGEGVLGGKEVVLAKPRTFMNHSREAVSYLMTRFRVSLGDLLIIYDDLDLPLGKVRIRPSGGAGGHRGVASIIAAVRSQDFPRIRVGIGRPPEGMEEVRYVLGSFTGEDGALMKQAVTTVRDAVADVLGHDLDWAMNRYN